MRLAVRSYDDFQLLPLCADRRHLVTTPKCGGKSACWDKPGPPSGYRMSSNAAARAKAAGAADHLPR